MKDHSRPSRPRTSSAVAIGPERVAERRLAVERAMAIFEPIWISIQELSFSKISADDLAFGLARPQTDIESNVGETQHSVIDEARSTVTCLCRSQLV